MQNPSNKPVLVSVIVAVYNIEKYIGKCIESIHDQTYENLEILLIDDGSTDSSSQICDDWQRKDSRIVVLHQANGGLSGARNKGIEMSHGEYLTFVDGDDWIDPDMIEVLLELCMDYKADISECQYREIVTETRFRRQSDTGDVMVMDNTQALESMLDWRYFKPMAWGKLFRRSVIGHSRFPLGKIHEDEFITYKYIYNADTLVHLDVIKYNYNRMRQESITARFEGTHFDRCEAFLERRKFFREHGIDRLAWKMNNAYCITVLDTMYQCYQKGINNEETDRWVNQAKQDITYFQNQPIDPYFVNEFKVLSISLEEYGKHRAEYEENLLHPKAEPVQDLPEPTVDYDALVQKNRELQKRIEDILNSRTWRCADKLKTYTGIKAIARLMRNRYSKTGGTVVLPEPEENPVSTEPPVNTEAPKPRVSSPHVIQFDYGHLLYEGEYKFYRFKSRRDVLYPLHIENIRVPYVKDLVSVVLPVFNGEDYVESSIESVLRQTYKNFELIIIDDGSTDSTPEIVDRYAAQDPRIRVVHQKNIRLPRTLSKGFRMARGEFFTWTSADNLMHETFLEMFVKDLQENPHIGMIWGNMRLIDENGDAIFTNDWYANAEWPEEVMFPRSVLELNIMPNNYIGAVFMYRAICANIVLDYSAFKFCTEDYDYWMKINETCTLRHTSFVDTLYSYRFHSNSLTSRDKELKITENRYKLMLLDDFRRDYLLKPMVWTFRGSYTQNPLYQKLRDIILKNGHLILEDGKNRSGKGNLYERIITVYFSETADNDLGTDPEEGTDSYKVLVAADQKEPAAEWDCCVCTGRTDVSENLGDYRGWFGISDAQTLFGFLDAKARIKFLYDMEERSDSVMQSTKTISVLLIYSGSLERMKSCIASIAGAGEDIEIVIATYGQEKAAELKALQKAYPGIVIAESLFADKVTQMNMAIWKSTGNILVFGKDYYLYSDGYFAELQRRMANRSVRAVCGSVKNSSDITAVSRDILGEHRFYKDGVLEQIERCYTANMAVKRDAVQVAGGLCHLSPEMDDECMEAPLFGLLKTIMKNDPASVYKSRFCTVYHQNIDAEKLFDAGRMKLSSLLGYYRLELQLILPYDTWTEAIAKNWNGLEPDINQYFFETVQKDFVSRSQVDWIRAKYSSLKMPDISVVIPVYNTEKELRRCVDSCLSQTMTNIEIILVDDGSTDSSGSICDEYAELDKRIRVIHKENGGLSDARNAGIDAAKGCYILFVDSDDWIDTDMCETLYRVAVLEQANIAECSYRNVYPDHTEEETNNSGIIIAGDAVLAMKSQLEWKYFKSVAWNKLYHQIVFADGKRYPKGRYHEDEFFTHKAFYSAGWLAYVDVSKYNYWHGRDGSITGNVSEKILDSCYALRERVDYVEEKGLQELDVPVKNMYCWMLLDRLYKCHKSGVNEDKLKKLLEDVQADRENVISWNIADEYKEEYRLLADSYEEFCARRDAAEKQEMRS